MTTAADLAQVSNSVRSQGPSIVRKKKLWLRARGPFPYDEYRCWYHLIRRCTDPRIPNFRDYGGRGIGVCERWRNDFMAFLSDMRPRPSRRHSIDRRDNDGDYTPENCRWATASQQSRNTRKVHQAIGCTYQYGRWTARMGLKGHRIFLGRFRTRAEARLAYRTACAIARLAAENEPPAPSNPRARSRRRKVCW